MLGCRAVNASRAIPRDPRSRIVFARCRLFDKSGMFNVDFPDRNSRSKSARAEPIVPMHRLISISRWKLAETAAMREVRGETSRNRVNSRFGKNLEGPRSLFSSRVHLCCVYRCISWSAGTGTISREFIDYTEKEREREREREKERDFFVLASVTWDVIKMSCVLRSCPARCSVTFGEFVRQFCHKSRFPLRFRSRLRLRPFLFLRADSRRRGNWLMRIQSG